MSVCVCVCVGLYTVKNRKQNKTKQNKTKKNIGRFDMLYSVGIINLEQKEQLEKSACGENFNLLLCRIQLSQMFNSNTKAMDLYNAITNKICDQNARKQYAMYRQIYQSPFYLNQLKQAEVM